MVQVALNWCRANGTTPIPGLRTPEQAQGCRRCAGLVIVTAGVQRLDAAAPLQRADAGQSVPEPLSVVIRPSEADSGAGLTTTGRLFAVIAKRNDFVLRGFQASGSLGQCPVAVRRREGFLQQGIEGCPRQSMPGDLQEGARKRFASSAPQSGVVLAMLLLVLMRPDEPRVTSRLVWRLDQGVAILRTLAELLLHVLNPPFEAFQNLLASLPM